MSSTHLQHSLSLKPARYLCGNRYGCVGVQMNQLVYKVSLRPGLSPISCFPSLEDRIFEAIFPTRPIDLVRTRIWHYTGNQVRTALLTNHLRAKFVRTGWLAHVSPYVLQAIVFDPDNQDFRNAYQGLSIQESSWCAVDKAFGILKCIAVDHCWLE